MPNNCANETSKLISNNSLNRDSGYESYRLRRPSTPSEKSWAANIGEDEWLDIEESSVDRAEVIAPDEGRMFSFRTLWAYAGPGWLMSIAYVDPGNLESDLQAGAYAGYDLVWVLFLSTAVGFFLQVLAARLGVVTGKNLAQLCRLEFPRFSSLVLWLMTEIAIIGSDVQEVLGSSIAFQILFGLPLWAGCLLTAFDTVSFLLLHKFGIRKLEAFFVALIGTMLFCFFLNYIESGVDYASVLSGMAPIVQPYAVTQAVGILGAVIMPHNIFLHSALVQSRQIDRRNLRKVAEANKYFSIEAGCALVVSFLINLAVLGVFSKGFFSEDCTFTFSQYGINSACLLGESTDQGFGSCQLSDGKLGVCKEIGLSYAGDALKTLLGGYARIIWAIGLLAAGQSSTMTGTYAGQFVMEGFLKLSYPPWIRVAITRSVALIPALLIALLSQQKNGAFDHIDELLNVLQSIQLPFAVLPVLHFTSNRELMGSFVNGKWIQFAGWFLAGFVCIINLYLVISKVFAESRSYGFYSIISVLFLSYFTFLGYLVHWDFLRFYKWIRGKEQ